MIKKWGSILFRKTLGIALMLFILVTGFSQTGIPYITHIESREGYENFNWSVCQDDHNNMLFANKKGLKSYDGSEWRYIEVPHVPLKIKKHPKTGIVYILSTNDAGYLKRDGQGIRHYIPILDERMFVDNSSSIFFTDNLVIFHGAQSIQAYNIYDHSLNFMYEAQPGERYSGMIATDEEELFVLIRNQGLFSVEADTLIHTGISLPNGEDEILFCLDHSEDEVLTGMRSGNLLVFNGTNFTSFPIDNTDYLIDNELSDGIALNDSTYLFSTLYGGAVLVNSMNGKIINTINYESGLPDDEIYAIGVDNYQGIWITYRFGISRLDPNLQVRDFSSYPGLEGLLTGVLSYNNILYVSTTTGLYRLSEVKNYEEVEIYIKREKPVVEKSIVQQKEAEEKVVPQLEGETEEQDEVGEKEEKPGFFKRLFSRRSNEKKEGEEDQSGEELNIKDESEAKVPLDLPSEEKPEEVVVQGPQYIKKTISRLKSIEFVYKKVEGITSNCQQMISTPNGILAGTSSGIFLINNGRAKLIDAIRNVNFISVGIRNSYLVTNDNEVIKVTETGDEWEVDRDILPFSEPFFSACETDSINTWVSGLDVVYRISQNETGTSSYKKFEFESIYPEELTLSMINDTLFLFSESMLQYYLPSADSFLVYDPFMEKKHFSSLRLFPSASGDFWIRLDDRIFPISEGTASYEAGYEIFNLFQNVSSFHSDGNDRYYIIDDYSRVYRIDLSKRTEINNDFDIFLEQISNEKGVPFSLNAPVFEPSETMVTLRLTAPYFLKDNSTQFQYLIEDRMEQWSEWRSESSVQLMTGPGSYRVKVRARNILGGISDPVEISFTIQPPFYRTFWFYVMLVPVVLGFLFLVIYVRERKLKHDKLLLEQKIKERTREIQVQKEQIESQKNRIQAQNNDITSSITYASKIQNAVLPDKKLFDKAFEEYFIFYRPRDIVSGDFYWITHKGKKTIFTVADCTGHGVPGAFMSMLGNSFLNEIIRTNSFSLSSDQILNQLRDKISAALAQSGEQSSTHDGMDIALCIYDRTKGEIQFSGAYNSLYLVRDGKLVIVKGDMMPIGYYPNRKDFTSHHLQVSKGDLLYLFSDGFPDQFGGLKNKKYTIGGFKKLLVNISDLPMEEQRRILDATLKDWSGENVQVDDVLVMGVKL